MKTARNWNRLGLQLVSATLGYNIVEAVVAIWSGIAAGSIALVGFGLDSVIECAAAAALLWRLGMEARGAERGRVERAERRVAIFVGLTFFALALYVIWKAGSDLWLQEAPGESLIGILLAAISLLIMPLLAMAKLQVAKKIGSQALRAEANETIACAYLSFALLFGLLTNALLGWWWADPVAALLMTPWLVREGFEAVRGECDGEGGADDA